MKQLIKIKISMAYANNALINLNCNLDYNSVHFYHRQDEITYLSRKVINITEIKIHITH